MVDAYHDFSDHVFYAHTLDFFHYVVDGLERKASILMDRFKYPLIWGIVNGFLLWFLINFTMLCLAEVFPYIIWHWGHFDERHGWAAVIIFSFIINFWWTLFAFMVMFFFIHFMIETLQRDRISKTALEKFSSNW
jgi:hypothetical protein